MYIINNEESEELRLFKNIYYSKKLSTTPNHICKILNGKMQCTGIIARGILSVRFNVLLTDNQIEELLEKYFIKVK